MLSKENSQLLLNIARQAISDALLDHNNGTGLDTNTLLKSETKLQLAGNQAKFTNNTSPKHDESWSPQRLPDELMVNGACFVTLTINGKLRGCIGSLKAHRPLNLDVIENAKAAAFADDRFTPLTAKELSQVKIEISVLSQPINLNYQSPDDLINKLDPKMGVILSYNNFSATFLPQVWQDLPDKIEFLELLAKKAGLSKDDWQKAEYQYYYVDSYKE